MDLKYAQIAFNTPKTKENMKSHHMTPLIVLRVSSRGQCWSICVHTFLFSSWMILLYIMTQVCKPPMLAVENIYVIVYECTYIDHVLLYRMYYSRDTALGSVFKAIYFGTFFDARVHPLHIFIKVTFYKFHIFEFLIHSYLLLLCS